MKRLTSVEHVIDVYNRMGINILELEQVKSKMGNTYYVQLGKKHNGRYNKSKVEYSFDELIDIINKRVPDVYLVEQPKWYDKMFNTKKNKKHKKFVSLSRDRDRSFEIIRGIFNDMRSLIEKESGKKR